ncbi:ParA family protein [Barnesiella intestinihominis]|uniref:ParA family protein n=1 Tax=Barnesiella intestinihominis TaxID=487174 RepID=UPI001896D682|nr:ParA family protein [Barnesiella intestinihominis]MDB0680572.1 ParA family protein [Barnesiella intestinihominis]
MSKEIFAAFYTQKGGAGKSTMTILVASYLHYVKNYNVAVIDCDTPQASICDLREHEIKVINENAYFKSLAYNHFLNLGKKSYPIIRSNAGDALDEAERLMREEAVKPDIIFFDLPGTLKSNDVIKTLSQMDYIFTPISADRLDMESSLQFVTLFNENLITTGIAKTKGLHLFWTKVDGREKNELYGMYESIMEEMNISIMKTRLPDSKRFRKEMLGDRKNIFRSTFFPAEKSQMKGSNIDLLSDEIVSLIKWQ